MKVKTHRLDYGDYSKDYIFTVELFATKKMKCGHIRYISSIKDYLEFPRAFTILSNDVVPHFKPINELVNNIADILVMYVDKERYKVLHFYDNK